MGKVQGSDMEFVIGMATALGKGCTDYDQNFDIIYFFNGCSVS
jgi:hypothetical protein